MSRDPASSRFRLPAGFSRLKPELGEVLQARRKMLGIKQEMLAGDVGITRTALSRIERGRSWPKFETLDLLLAALELPMERVVVQGTSNKSVRIIDSSPQGIFREELGRALRDGRKAYGLTLAEMAELSGVSAAQLSRIERAQCRRSHLFAVHDDYLDRHKDDQRLKFTNAVLQHIVTGEFEVGGSVDPELRRS